MPRIRAIEIRSTRQLRVRIVSMRWRITHLMSHPMMVGIMRRGLHMTIITHPPFSILSSIQDPWTARTSSYPTMDQSHLSSLIPFIILLPSLTLSPCWTVQKSPKPKRKGSSSTKRKFQGGHKIGTKSWRNFSPIIKRSWEVKPIKYLVFALLKTCKQMSFSTAKTNIKGQALSNGQEIKNLWFEWIWLVSYIFFNAIFFACLN